MKVSVPDDRLPRGPHRLTRAEVAESQRGRLFIAMLDAVAESGYHPVTVADLVARAKISRRTFYELFDSKEECFAAAFEMVVEVANGRLTAAIKAAGQLDWRQLVCTSLTAYFDILAEEPAIARALHVEALIAGPPLAGYRRRLMTVFADRMRAARELAVQQDELSGQLPDVVYDFLIGGIDDRIRECMQTAGPAALPGLARPLCSIALTLLDCDAP
ncbi:TetR/AcrR family transcriptional regulator [Nocardia sp. NBC_01327]|uniref:TetR/AcrR family transcriptional regulator n=1 Tax=Nocardia sp. NBC_01327 TaxID=2903593 RepID=UPI002E16477F|nr:TetR/AcrR family transcriptional regulator [Nocardia sp. NBC_01327]